MSLTKCVRKEDSQHADNHKGICVSVPYGQMQPRQELSRLEQMLIEAQQTAEEIYLNRTEPDANA